MVANMKTYKSFLQTVWIILFSIFFFNACEEVIDVDLNSSDPQLVIEGTINDQAGPYYVKISKTADYFTPSEYPMISGAEILISDSEGTVDRLIETEPGIYQTDSLVGIPGRTYFMKVILDGKTYTSQSTMPEPIEIDSLSYELDDFGGGDDDNEYEIKCYFQDTPNFENHFRFKVFKNDKFVNNIFIYYDRLFDGNYIEYDQISVDFNINDEVKIELWSFDREAYTYYSTLKEALAVEGQENPLASSEPANPVSNITGNVLGYFCAYSVRTDSLVIR